jgi:hypothetical protein
MTVYLRPPDELVLLPQLATLPALSGCIDAFVAALDVTHPALLGSVNPRSDRETAALLLHMHLDVCQQLLREYDRLTFDTTRWCCAPDDDEPEDEDDIPF